MVFVEYMCLLSLIHSHLFHFDFFTVSFRAMPINPIEQSACYSVLFRLSERSERMEKSPNYEAKIFSKRSLHALRLVEMTLGGRVFLLSCHFDWSVSGMEKSPVSKMLPFSCYLKSHDLSVIYFAKKKPA